MATSELSDRLDYLISYSSQLVFVCTDKIKQQSLIVESFLAQQGDQAEVALVTADPLKPLVTYREAIFKQLLSPTQDVDFNNPLNQLLAPLNHKEGAVLISIFQADKLPNKLVKEIWELVLQSRFANNKQHLNVLLLGESSWAEQMKSALASRSKDKPIILKSSFDSQPNAASLDEENYQSLENTDLETLLQQKRQKFAERVKDRNQHTYVDKPLLKKWWMISLLSLVFIATFAGILSWQYSDNILEWLAKTNKVEDISQPPVLTPDTVIDENPMQLEIKQVTEEVSSSDQLATPEINHNLETLLVTDWQTAVSQIKDNTQQLEQPISTTDALNISEIPIATNLTSKQSIETIVETIPERLVTKKIDSDTVSNDIRSTTENDYAVADITEFKPLQIEPNPLEILPQKSKLPSQFLEGSKNIMALPSVNFIIQIAAMTDIKLLMDYIADGNLESELWIVQTQRNEQDWYVVINNQHFSSIEAAKLHMEDLSPAMLKNSPFIKQVRHIQQEITAQVH